jgi:hypothetical protein
MTTVLSTLCVLAGSTDVACALQTAIRTFLLPQPGLSRVSRSGFRAARLFFSAVERVPSASARRRARTNISAPLCRVLIVFAAMGIISLGYTLILHGSVCRRSRPPRWPASPPSPRSALSPCRVAWPSPSWPG